MPIASGYPQLQPNFILGTDQWVSAVAEQMVGAGIDQVNQLRDHFPFFPIGRGSSVVVPRVAGLGTAAFVDPGAPMVDDTVAKLSDPPETVDMACLEGTVNQADFAADIQSYSIDQLDLQVEFKKIAIRVAFWQQFFGASGANGFRGLPELAAPSQLASIGRKLKLEDMDAVVAGVTEGEAEMDRKIVVMNSATFGHYVMLVRGTGAPLTYTMFNGRRYASHNGVPILICDFVRAPGTANVDGADVWCMTLGMEDNGVFGVVPEDVGDAGLVIDHVQGALETASVVYRLRWYCNVILGHTRGLAGLTDVQVTQPALVI